MTTAVRKDLPAMPDRMKKLPVDDRGYPVPWFVEWIDGKPDFRVMSHEKLLAFVRGERRCWTCGGPLGHHVAFVVGPMCAVNRIAAEPPSHLECALFAATACPFLTRPKAKRREANKPEGLMEPAGTMIPRNPGVTLVWVTRRYDVEDTKAKATSRYLFRMGPADRVLCYAEGRPATKEEIAASVESGLPLLEQACEREITPRLVTMAKHDLVRQVTVARKVLGLA